MNSGLVAGIYTARSASSRLLLSSSAPRCLGSIFSRLPGGLRQLHSGGFLGNTLYGNPSITTTNASTRPDTTSTTWDYIRSGYGVRQFSTTQFHRNDITTATPTPAVSSGGGGNIEQLATSSQELWAADAAKILAEGESLSSLGLGGYSPIGLLQSFMDLLHSTTGLPWWGAILASTLCIRVLFLPVNVYLQKHAIKTHNVQPLVKKMKERQQIYMLAKNLEMANYERNRMNVIFRKHGVRPILSLMPMLFQGVVLFSYFMAIRGMANAPVTSMMAGGALWFTDLTATDPTLVLPIICSGAFLISAELGGESGMVNPDMKKMQNVVRILAILMIPLTSQLPAGLFMYWIPSTCFSISLSMLMKVQGVRDALGYPKLIKHAPSEQTEMTWKQRRDTKMVIEEKRAEYRKLERQRKKQREDKNPKLFTNKPQATKKK